MGHGTILRTVVSLTCLLIAPALAADKPTPTGAIEYPLRYNLNPQEGTLECWLQLHTEPADYMPVKEGHKTIATLFHLSGETGGVSWSYHIGSPWGNDKVGWYIRFEPNDRMRTLGDVVHFKKGEWHHVALVWKGRETWFYVDGKQASYFDQTVSFDAVLGSLHGPAVYPDRPFYIGDRWHVASRYVIDDMRLSHVARKPEQLGFHGPLEPDPFTAILDNYEETFVPDAKQKTTPAMILWGDGGLPSPQCRFVEGKFGKGLALFGE